MQSTFPQAFEIPSIDRDHRTIATGPLFALVIHGELSELAVRRMLPDIETHAENHSRGMALLIVSEPTASLPNDRARSALRTVLHIAFEERWICSACPVLEADGFAAAAHRGALQGVLTSANAGARARVCSSVQEAIAWSGQRLRDVGTTLDGAATLACLDRARAVVLPNARESGARSLVSPARLKLAKAM